MRLVLSRRTALLLALAFGLAAGPAAIAAEDAQGAIRSALGAQQGKRVYLRLQSDEELAGKVDSIGEATLRLSELQGRDFYDAVVRLDRIDAVIVKAR